MAILLYRVDERLIHGQVVVGWGNRLRPSRYLVVDDVLADSEWERDLYRLGLPQGVEAEFVAVSEARRRLSQWRSDPVPSILLTRDLEAMARLSEEGGLAGQEVNLGGIHHAPGKEEVLSYLFLGQEDRRDIQILAREGVDVVAQDLPGSPRRAVQKLLT